MNANRSDRSGYVLITGASSGIGKELARLFAEDGYSLIITARSEGKLEKLKKELIEQYGVAVEIIVKDLGKPEAADQLYGEIAAKNLTVDILVNNAGYGTSGKFHKIELNDEIDMINVNLICLTKLTKLYLKEFVAKNSGKILNVGSTASFAPVVYEAAYGATKAFVLSLTEAIAEEYKDTNITVTALCRGVLELDLLKELNFKIQ